MKTCIIHIGMHKTGSTALQATLKNYDDGKTHYADLSTQNFAIGKTNHSVPLVTIFKTNPEKYEIHKQWARSPDKIARMKAEWIAALEKAATMPRERMILSGEGLSLRLSTSEVARMVEYFRERFERIQVVAYVRDFHSFATSAFQQKVKSGRSTFWYPEVKYRRRFEGWALATEPKELVFRPYLSQRTVADFFDLFSLDITKAAAQERNESLSAPALALMFAFNRAVSEVPKSPRKERARIALISYLKTIPGERFSFSPEVLADALAKHADDIRWMEEFAGMSLTGSLQPQGHVFGSERDILSLARKSRTLIDTDVPAARWLFKKLG